MPAKKKEDGSPIQTHKTKDITEVREVLLEIIRSDTSKEKDRIEASKLLARMHHALQVDKVTAKATAKQEQTQAAQTLTKIEEEKLKKILDGS